MPSNQFLSTSLSLNQQLHQQSPIDDSLPTQQSDNTFFHKYISQSSTNNGQQKTQIKTNSDNYQPHDYQSILTPKNHPQAANSTYDSESELYLLKQHLSTIESIAMKEIQQLKRQLELQRQQKQLIVESLEKVRSNSEGRILVPEIGENDMVRLLKQENKMLKQALKKQLHINKNLIKSQITNNSEHQSPQPQQQQANKQNSSLTSNSQQQQPASTFLLKPNIFDRPTIPHPTSQSKRLSLR